MTLWQIWKGMVGTSAPAADGTPPANWPLNYGTKTLIGAAGCVSHTTQCNLVHWALTKTQIAPVLNSSISSAEWQFKTAEATEIPPYLANPPRYAHLSSC